MKILVLFSTLLLAACSTSPRKTVTDRTQVKSTVQSIMPQVKECYAKALRQNSDLKGKMTTSFEVNDQGKVSGCQVKKSEFHNLSIESCICQKISNTTFSPAPKGKMAKIDYPLVFNYKE